MGVGSITHLTGTKTFVCLGKLLAWSESGPQWIETGWFSLKCRMCVTSIDSESALKLRKATWLCCLLGCTTASPWTPPSISRWVTFTLYFYPFKVCWQLQNPQTIFAVWLDQQLSPLIGNYISSGFSYQVSESDLRCKIYKRWKWSHRPSLNCISWA